MADQLEKAHSLMDETPPKLEQAIVLFEQYFKKHGQINPLASMHLGICYMEVKKPKQALSHFQIAEDLFGSFAKMNIKDNL